MAKEKAAEMEIPEVNFGDLGDVEWTPYEGDGWPDLVANGYYEAKCVKATAGIARSGDGKVTLIFAVLDEDFAGSKLLAHVPYTGTRSDGAMKILSLLDALYSMGWTKEQINKLREKGKKFSGEEVAEEMTGKTFHLEATQTSAEDKEGHMHEYSDCRFIAPDRYAQLKKDNLLRKKTQVRMVPHGPETPVAESANASAAAKNGAPPPSVKPKAGGLRSMLDG